MPIVRSDGTFFGTLCAVDPERRALTAEQTELLGALARLLATHIERDEAAARAEARANELREVVAMVSHDLRAPLSAIALAAETLLTRELAEVHRRELLALVYAESNRLTELIGEFLDLHRLESGAGKPMLRAVDLHALLSQAAVAAGQDPTHPVRVDVPEDLPPALADPDWIRRVVDNLVTNARKYSPGGGEVRLSARPVDGMLEVCVADKGLGIPSEALPYVFERFYRVDSRDRRSIPGTGLGLAICREIVEAHGGQIRAESAGLGKGSRFYFTLPLN